MKKGQILEGTVREMVFPGKGLVEIDMQAGATENAQGLAKESPPAEAQEMQRRYVAVKNALPGQRIRLRVTKARRGKAEGQLLEILSPGPLEQPADCPHFGMCGGCVLRTLPYEEQLRIKERQVLDLLGSVCDNPRFTGILPSPAYAGYRNKMEFSFGDAFPGGPLCLGMHRRGSFYDIVTADQCQIVDEDFRSILRCVLTVCGEAKLPYYHRMRHTGYLRHLLVRKARHTGEILIDLITTGNTEQLTCSETDLEERLVLALTQLQTNGRIAGILHTKNDSVADVIKDEGTRVLWGKEYFSEELLGLRFKITPFSFFQTNSAGAEVLYEKVREYVGETKDKVLYDLYSGTGTIAQLLSPVAESVTGVEIVPEAVEAARENAALNGLGNCSFIAGDVLKVLDDLTRKPDIIVLDPPRDGVHPRALPKIAAYGVDRIIYVSCKITSLVRDLVYLQNAGYMVTESCAVDMFPATAGIETIALLEKR